MVDTETAATISLPRELLKEIDEAATEAGLSRERLLRAAVRRFVHSDRRWRSLQAEASARARAMGIHTEDDVEDFLDSLSAED